MFDSLKKVLVLLDYLHIQETPNQLATLQSKCRCWLPIIKIKKDQVSMRKEKQPAGIPTPSINNLFFFDLQVIACMLLSATLKVNFHTGMVEVVDSLIKYWHRDCYGSSIWTCSNDFIKYLNQMPVFLSDIIQYHCLVEGCGIIHPTHCGQITFFGQDRWPTLLSFDKTILRIWPLVNHATNSTNCQYNISNDELLLVEHSVRYICSH